ncbi:MAG: hypothetical protein JXQ29_00855 [Planctomycetes bacterium]|nr:hypothetical protein [Planctomycetota bacterium]
MRTHRFGFLVAVVVLLAFAFAASGQDAAAEKVLLRYQFKPGEEQRYTVAGDSGTTLTMPQGEEKGPSAKFSGGFAVFTAAVDAETKSALVGFRWDLTAEMKMEGMETEKRTDTLRMLQIGRLSVLGAAVPRKEGTAKKGTSPQENIAAMAADHLTVAAIVAGILPEQAVGLDDTWEDDAALPILSLPFPVRQRSTLKEIKLVDGCRCAAIATTFARPEKIAGPMAEALDMKVSGTGNCLFDIDSGRAVEIKILLSLAAREPGADRMDLACTVKLAAVEDVAEGEAAARVNVLEALQKAVACLDDGKADDAVKAMEEVRDTALEPKWKECLESTEKTIHQVQRFARGRESLDDEKLELVEEEELLDEAEQLMDRADEKGKDGRWEAAVAELEALAEKHPGHRIVPQALARAAEICEKHLDRKDKATALRKRVVALREKAASAQDAGPNAVYALAAALAEAGEIDRAIQSYLEVAASTKEGLAPRTRVLAQHRAAGLLEKQGKTAEAIAAYQAVAGIPADDDYSRKLKALAATKAEELATPR